MLSLADGRNRKERRALAKIRRYPRPKGVGRIKRVPKPYGYKPSPRVIIKRDPTPEELQDWLSSVSGFVGALTCDMDGNPSKFYDYQQQHMENPATFRSIDKARQVGFSYTFAAESLSKCHLKGIQTSIFISYNQEEANEKIRFAKALYESMPTEYQKKLVVDNKQSLEFELKGKRTRILSFAQRQPRGKGYNTDIYLDEFAHMMWGRSIYTAALPVLTRGSGVLTVASTPLGKSNLHYEISTDMAGDYDMFSRMQVFWWDCPELCKDIEKARREAPTMMTEERVARFATEKLAALFKASESIESFMQEYELYYADESLSYFPLDLIKHCVFEEGENLEDNIDPEEIEVGWAPVDEDGKLVAPDTIMNAYANEKFNWYYDGARFFGSSDAMYDAVVEMVDKFILMMTTTSFGRNLLAGVDIGRKRDTSEISIFEQVELPTHNIHIERMSIELDNVKFKMQRRILRLLLQKLPIRKMRIDSTGIGSDIAETIQDEYSGRVESVDFNMENKGEMAKNFRFRLEDRAIALFNDAHAIKQIHSIKKTTTEASHVKYGTEKYVKDHHGDKFWAKALASSGGDSYDRSRILSTILKYSGKRIFSDGSLTSDIKTPTIIPIVSSGIGVRPVAGKKSIEFANPMLSIFADTEFREVW